MLPGLLQMKQSHSTDEGNYASKAEKREFEEKEKRQASVAKRIDVFSSSLDNLVKSSSSNFNEKVTASFLKIKVQQSSVANLMKN